MSLYIHRGLRGVTETLRGQSEGAGFQKVSVMFITGRGWRKTCRALRHQSWEDWRLRSLLQLSSTLTLIWSCFQESFFEKRYFQVVLEASVLVTSRVTFLPTVSGSDVPRRAWHVYRKSTKSDWVLQPLSHPECTRRELVIKLQFGVFIG